MSNVFITGANSGFGLLAVVEPGVFATNFTSNSVTAPGFDADSPHWANAQRYGAALRPTMQASRSGADSHEVADLVLEAATTTAAPVLRFVAGADARFDPGLQTAGVQVLQGRHARAPGLVELGRHGVR